MRSRYVFKITAIIVLAMSLAAISILSFTDSADAARRKRKSKPRTDTLAAELDEAAREFVRRERIPNSVLRAGDIYVLKSYTSQFKAIRGDGAAIFSEPNTNSKRILKLRNGAKLTAEAEFVGRTWGDWYYVRFRSAKRSAKGWVHSRFITERDPD